MNIQAFPGERFKHVAGYLSSEREPVAGMTLRDYFAAKAMPVLMSEVDGVGDDHPGSPRFDSEEIGRLAYFYADAMLKARQS